MTSWRVAIGGVLVSTIVLGARAQEPVVVPSRTPPAPVEVQEASGTPTPTRESATTPAVSTSTPIESSPGRDGGSPPIQDPPDPPAPTPNPTPGPEPTPQPTPVPTQEPPTDAPAVESKPATPPADAAGAPVLDYSGRFDFESYTREVTRLVAAHPARARRASLGTSRGGREIVLLTLGEIASGEPDRRPAVLLVTGLDPAFEGRPAGCEPALFAARALLQRAEAEPTVAAWLARTTVYVVPAPDPDLTFAPEGAPPRACRLDRNFPCAWRPWSSETCAQGPYPLSEPETRSVARFLSSRTNIGAVVLLSRGVDVAPAVAGTSGELERVLFEKLAAHELAAGVDARAVAEGWARRAEAFTRESGSLAAFCRERLSAFVWPLDPFAGDVVESPLGRAPARFASVAESVRRVADEMARLTCTVGATERLRERLWKIDLEVTNGGLLPTLPEGERSRSPGSVWFDATGGRISQVGLSRGGAPQTNARPRPPSSWSLGHLDGNETLRLFVLVDGPEGTNVEFTVRTQRGAETRCAVTLH